MATDHVDSDSVGVTTKAPYMNPWFLDDMMLLSPLWLIPAALFGLAAMLWPRTASQSHWRKVLSEPVFQFLNTGGIQHSRWNLVLLAAMIVTACMSQPVMRQSDDDTWRHSIGWIAVADVSRSMTLDDTVPSRLSAMRESLGELSRQAGARPIALILFSGDAFLVAPPAFDRSVFDEHAALIEHGVIPTEGSNLARALSLATSVINDSQFIHARVFVLGDSGGITSNTLAAARHLSQSGHQLDTLVYGVSDSSTTSTDDQTTVNWENTSALSKAGNGQSVRANHFGVIDYTPLKLKQQASASTNAELQSLVWRDQSHWLLILALPLLLLLFKQEIRG